MLWGARSGVQFALALVALKALPVLIIGGFTSVPGAIVAGLIVGAFEKLAEVYHRPVLSAAASKAGSRTCSRSLFLLIRPGRAVRRKDHPAYRSDVEAANLSEDRREV